MLRVLSVALLSVLTAPAWAQAPAHIAIHDNKFVPAELTVPANTKIELIVKNERKVMAEFESTALHREKIVPPGGQVSISVGPLSPGRYEFFDDFNQTARGVVIVK